MTVDVATLVFEFKSDSAAQAEKAMDRLIERGDRLEASAKKVRRATDMVAEGQRGAAASNDRAAQGAMGLAQAEGAVEKAARKSIGTASELRALRALDARQMKEVAAQQKAAAAEQTAALRAQAAAAKTAAAERAAAERMAAQAAKQAAAEESAAASARAAAIRDAQRLELKVQAERVALMKQEQREQAAAAKTLDAQIASAMAGHERLNGTVIKSVGVSRAATQAGLNLTRQLADIGVTGAMGMNPLMIFIQQAPQIADAFQTAKTQGLGFSQVMKSLALQLGLVRATMPPVIAAQLELATAQQATAASALEVAVANRAKMAGTAQAAAADEAAAVAAGALARANQAVAVTAAEAAAAESLALAPLAVALGVIATAASVAFGAAALGARELNKDNKDLLAGLDLTQKQLDHLKKKGVETGITIGDVFKGTFNYLRDGAASALAPIGKWFGELFDDIASGAVKVLKVLVGGFVGAYEAIKQTWGLLPRALSDMAIQAANAVIGAVEGMINKALAGLNKLIDLANAAAKIAGVDGRLQNFDSVDLGRIANWDAGAAAKAGETAGTAFAKGFAKGGAGVDKVLGDIGKSITKAAEDRIRKAAGDAGKTPKGPATPRDLTDEQSARIAAQVQQAMQEELQARLAITREVSDRAVIEKQIAVAALAEKQARIDQQIASINDPKNKGLDEAAKAEQSARLRGVKIINEITSALQVRGIDEAAIRDITAEELSSRREGLQNHIDLLGAQADITKSAYARAVIEVDILKASQELEKATLRAVTIANGANAAQVVDAQARLLTLNKIHDLEMKQAKEEARLVNGIKEAANAALDFASALKRHDWAGAFNAFSDTLQSLSAASGGTGPLASMASSAAAASPYVAIIAAFSKIDSMLSKSFTKLFGGDAKQQRNAETWGQLGIIPGALAALFGGKSSNHGAGIALTPTGLGAFSGGRRNEETEQAATATASAILAGEKLLRDAGITLGATVHGLVIGTRDLSQIYLTNGQTITSAVGDAAAAAEASLKAVLASATFVSDAQKALIEGMVAAGKGFEDIAQALETYKAAQMISGGIADEILKLADPKAFDIQAVKRDAEAQRKAAQEMAAAGYLTADQLAGINVQLATLEGLKLDEVMKRYADSVDAANDNLSTLRSATESAEGMLMDAYNTYAQAKQAEIDGLRQAAEGLKAFRKELDYGATAGRDPVSQLAATRREFDRLNAMAAGDPERVANLQSVTQAFVEASRAASPTELAFGRDLAAARRATEASQLAATAQADYAQMQLDQQTAAVGQLIQLNATSISIAQAIANLAAARANEQAGGGAANDNLDVSRYLAMNPDLARNWNAGGSLHGVGSTLEEAARAHYASAGQYEIAQGLRKYATGGSFMVGGGGGTDSQLVQFMASPDERVDVLTPSQQRGGGDNSEVVAELRATREALAGVRAELADIKRNTKESADFSAEARAVGIHVRGAAPDEPVITQAA